MVGRGFRSAVLQNSVPLGDSFAGQAARERRVVSILNLRDEPASGLRSPLFQAEGFVTYYGIPLIAKGQAKGVLEVFLRRAAALDPERMTFLDALAGQAAMGVAGDDLIHLRRGALLHDIGKMSIPDSILLKPGPLTPDEWVIMRQHPQAAFELFFPINFLRPALDVPFCHHEKWDGNGYPRGLKQDEIPQAARVFAVVDVWDAFVSIGRTARHGPRRKCSAICATRPAGISIRRS